MRPATVTRIEVADGWAAIETLRGLIAQDDPMALRGHVPVGRLYPAEIHAYVKDRVRYLHGAEQRWATPLRTLLGGYGDCGNSSRLIIAMGRFYGVPARLRVFTKTEREPGVLGRPYTYPAHVAAELGDEGRWAWAEAVVPADFGEHPLAAARRLGIHTTIHEAPMVGGGELPRVVGGPWPYGGHFPRHVTAAVHGEGRAFTRARAAWPFYPGVVAQYREDVARGSMHLDVMGAGGGQPMRWRVTHADAVNPDRGSQVEHLWRDVIRGVHRATIGAMQVAPTKTPVSPADMYQAMVAQWPTGSPTQGQVMILLAQWALETANGASMVQWNIGNVKHVSGDGLDWCTYTTTEGSGANVQTLQQSFKAYPNLQAGLGAFFAMFQGSGRYASAWPSVESGDVDGFAQALKAKGYYTASEASYAAGMKARLAQLEALGLPSPSSFPGPIVAAVAVLGLGFTYAWSQGWLPTWSELTRWI